jgi:hypothetical protein
MRGFIRKHVGAATDAMSIEGYKGIAGEFTKLAVAWELCL